MSAISELSSLEELDAALARTARPIVIFKHSPTCGTSAQAHEEIEELAARQGLDADVYVVSVVESRPVSNAIAARFGIRHESPQVLVVRDGHVRWHASHFKVTAARIVDALAAESAGAGVSHDRWR